jgi:hypothetical protein
VSAFGPQIVSMTFYMLLMGLSVVVLKIKTDEIIYPLCPANKHIFQSVEVIDKGAKGSYFNERPLC